MSQSDSARKLGLMAVVVVIVGAIIAAGVWFAGGGDEPAGSEDVAVRAGDHSLVLGPDDAEVKVTVFEDFQCPYCREFEMSSRDFLQEYASDGIVQVEYRPFNLLEQFPYSGRALSAFIAVLEEGTPEQALEVHDRLFDEQPYEQDSDSIGEATIAEWVAEAGATGLSDALAADRTAWFTAARDAAVAAQIQGTPAVLVDGEPFGAGMSVTQMADALESLLADR